MATPVYGRMNDEAVRRAARRALKAVRELCDARRRAELARYILAEEAERLQRIERRSDIESEALALHHDLEALVRDLDTAVNRLPGSAVLRGLASFRGPPGDRP
ncbi:hypothetical protein [Kiritimatiella glycovorans]|nr:hypothetical protein [Kiritimatiella glycovorans]